MVRNGRYRNHRRGAYDEQLFAIPWKDSAIHCLLVQCQSARALVSVYLVW